MNTQKDPVQPEDKKTTSTSSQESDEVIHTPAVETKKSWSAGKTFQSIMNGTFLTRDNVIRYIPYLFFLAFLGLIYIANTYYAEKTVKSIDQYKKELKELRYEHITVKSELMYLSKQSEVLKRIEGTGIKPTVTPPMKITIPATREKSSTKQP